MIARIKQHRLARRAAWDIVRLFSGTLSDRERERITRRRNDSKDYQNSFVSGMQALSDLDALANDPDILTLAPKPQAAAQYSVPAIPWQWPVFTAATAVLLGIAMGVGLLYSPVQEKSRGALYVTRIGEQKTVNLADGTVITLNTGTQLWVDLSRETRRVILERGEAYFVVASDPVRPFTVDLGLRSITVLGTEFNILKSPEQFTLAVVAGAVGIHKSEETLSPATPLLRGQQRVTAGMVAEFDAEQQQIATYQPKNVDRFYSWRTGMVRFDEEPLGKAVQLLNRYSTKKILIEDSSIMDMEVYAIIRLDRIDAALTVLEQSLPVKVTRHFDRIVISKREKKE